MIYNLKNELSLRNFHARVRNLINKSRKNEVYVNLREIKPPNKERSNYLQLLHLYCNYLANIFGLPYGFMYTKIFKGNIARKYYVTNFYVVGKKYIWYKSSSMLTEDELLIVFNLLRLFALNEYSIYLPNFNETELINTVKEYVKIKFEDEKEKYS